MTLSAICVPHIQRMASNTDLSRMAGSEPKAGIPNIRELTSGEATAVISPIPSVFISPDKGEEIDG